MMGHTVLDFSVLTETCLDWNGVSKLTCQTHQRVVPPPPPATASTLLIGSQRSSPVFLVRMILLRFFYVRIKHFPVFLFAFYIEKLSMYSLTYAVFLLSTVLNKTYNSKGLMNPTVFTTYSINKNRQDGPVSEIGFNGKTPELIFLWFMGYSMFSVSENRIGVTLESVTEVTYSVNCSCSWSLQTTRRGRSPWLDFD